MAGVCAYGRLELTLTGHCGSRRGRNLGGGIAVVHGSGIPVLRRPSFNRFCGPAIRALYETEKLNPFAT